MPVTISGVIPVNLSQLHDVNIVSPVSGQYLRYSGTSWQNSYLNSDVFNYLNTSLTGTNGVTLDFSIPNNIKIGLATVNPTTGTFGSSSSVPVVTVDSQGRITGITTATISGVASATVLSTARNISASGDATWTVLFNGSADVTSPLTFATVNASPQIDTFRKITINGKGLVTASSAVSASDIETALAYTPVNKAGDTMAGTLILNADPTVPLGAATKQYADAISSGVNIHASCETASSTTLAATYANGAGGVGATLTSTINGAISAVGGYGSLIVGSRILVKDQASSPSNGIYVVTDLGSPSTPWILTRALDFDGSPTFEISAGDLTYISEGIYAGTQWVETAIGTGLPGDYIIVGTDPINFTQFSGPSTYIAGTGINISATTISNTGVTSLIAGANVSLSGSTGDITISTTGTVPSSTTAANLAGGSAGSIPYQTGPNTTAMLAAGTGVLVGGSIPTYSSSPSLIGTNFSGTATSLNIGGNAGTVTNGVYTTDTGTVTNTMLSGSIANAKLSNSAVTIGTTSLSLGTSTLSLSGLTTVSAITFSGSGSGLTSIPNSALVGSGNITLGSTAVALGSSVSNISGLSSVTATSFNGPATSANSLNSANAYTGTVFTASASPATGQFNAVAGSGSSWFNSMWRNDGSNVYMLSSSVQTTQAAANIASWNSFRPFAWNLTTGVVSIDSSGAGSTFGGPITGSLNGTATYVSGTQQVNIITGKQQSMNMGSSSADGSFVCRSSGSGDANMAGITYWNDAYAIKMGIRADGSFGLGGWSRSAWSWYSDPSGNMVAAGNVAAYSDPRLKENIKPIVGAIELLSSIDGVYFNWKHGIAHTEVKAGKTDIGILADQVEAVFPEIVTESIEIEGQRYKTVAYDKLVPVLIEAIKELSATNKDLLARIQALEAK